MNDTRPHLSKTEVRAGETPHIVRYILMISMTLAIAFLTLVLVL